MVCATATVLYKLLNGDQTWWKRRLSTRSSTWSACIALKCNKTPSEFPASDENATMFPVEGPPRGHLASASIAAPGGSWQVKPCGAPSRPPTVETSCPLVSHQMEWQDPAKQMRLKALQGGAASNTTREFEIPLLRGRNDGLCQGKSSSVYLLGSNIYPFVSWCVNNVSWKCH